MSPTPYSSSSRAVGLMVPPTGTETTTLTAAVRLCRGVECLSRAASRWEEWGWGAHYTAYIIAMCASVLLPCALIQNNNTMSNFQCGYRVREAGQETRFSMDINTQGCLVTASTVITNSGIVLGGIGIGLVVLEVSEVM